ncbi:hypothetical protein [Streptomyces sp. CC208A]|uniref:hypothetical protein n=1 Tax=Streptomyces sp. CC208A TaxID=3044573 RepID=UPI0024A7DDE8|nr:hypothetical protein [Streptomyces sp. CC208A]
MTPAVLALGAGAVTVSGCVWYVPALADLRAGADRPRSRRLAATACLTGWSTAAAVTLLLLLGAPGALVLGPAVTGATATALLRVGAAVRRSEERREDGRCWAALSAAPPPSHCSSQRIFARCAGTGLLLATVCALCLLSVRRAADGSGFAVMAVPVVLAGVALVVASTAAVRRRAG